MNAVSILFLPLNTCLAVVELNFSLHAYITTMDARDADGAWRRVGFFFFFILALKS